MLAQCIRLYRITDMEWKTNEKPVAKEGLWLDSNKWKSEPMGYRSWEFWKHRNQER
jgi:hypothetical protein